jgi:hypothetical protein
MEGNVWSVSSGAPHILTPLWFSSGGFLGSFVCFRRARVNLDFQSPTVSLIKGTPQLGGDHENQHPVAC